MRLSPLLWLVTPLLASAATSRQQHNPANSLTRQDSSNHEQVSLNSESKDSKSAKDPPAYYDARFKQRPLDQDEHQAVSRELIEAYLYTCRELGVSTWLMGNSLLGWWWGKKASKDFLIESLMSSILVLTRRKLLPWDATSNVQITEPSLYFLAAYHNTSIHYHKGGITSKGRKYLLEISSNYQRRERYSEGSADGRWTDLATGLYLNITAVRYNPGHANGEGMLDTKNGQELHDTQLYPLWHTTFEGAPAKIPFRYKEMLIEAYGEDALKKTKHNGYKFDEPTMRWFVER